VFFREVFVVPRNPHGGNGAGEHHTLYAGVGSGSQDVSRARHGGLPHEFGVAPVSGLCGGVKNEIHVAKRLLQRVGL